MRREQRVTESSVREQRAQRLQRLHYAQFLLLLFFFCYFRTFICRCRCLRILIALVEWEQGGGVRQTGLSALPH